MHDRFNQLKVGTLDAYFESLTSLTATADRYHRRFEAEMVKVRGIQRGRIKTMTPRKAKYQTSPGGRICHRSCQSGSRRVPDLVAGQRVLSIKPFMLHAAIPAGCS
jgi:hypothetical protein